MTEYEYDAIIKQGTRILMPSEYEKMRKVMISEDSKRVLDDAVEAHNWPKADKIQRYQIICDAMLHTGMRRVEFAAMQRNWYRGPRRVIMVPDDACGKQKCLYKERTVMLSLPGCDAVDRFLQSGLSVPTLSSMHEALNNYAEWAEITTAGITTKMFRKTLASWLMACFPEMEMYISASMGHTREVLQKHYLGLGFPTEEVRKMKEVYLVEWGRRL